MEYFLKIKSEFNTLVQADNKMTYKLNKDSFISFKLEMEENESCFINIEPLTKTNDLVFPYKIYVRNCRQNLEINSSNIELFNYKNHFLITLKKFEGVKDLSILYNQDKVLIYNTFYTNVILQNTSFSLKEKFTKVENKTLGSKNIYLLENEDKRYVLVTENNKIIFKDYYNEIKLDKNIQILSYVNDIAKHAFLTTIDNENKSKLVYVNNSPRFTKNEKLIPLAFIQSLKIKNLKLCKYYLNEDLKRVSTIENLTLFFGDFNKVEPILNENCLVLFYNDKSYKIFKFDINNSKIKKIELK